MNIGLKLKLALVSLEDIRLEIEEGYTLVGALKDASDDIEMSERFLRGAIEYIKSADIGDQPPYSDRGVETSAQE